jgi:hypothetical protein
MPSLRTTPGSCRPLYLVSEDGVAWGCLGKIVEMDNYTALVTEFGGREAIMLPVAVDIVRHRNSFF